MVQYSQQVELGQRGKHRAQGNSVHEQNTVLIVPTKAQSYRKTLYFFNFILSGLGLTLISLGVVIYMRPDNVLLPTWVVWYFGAIGLVQLLFGVIASRGAVIAKRYIEQGMLNYYLYTFLLFMTTILLVEIVIVVIVVIRAVSWDQKDVNHADDFVTDYMEQALISEFETREKFWWEVQKSWKCCGWSNNTIPDSLATGKYCTTNAVTSGPACKNDMEGYVKENSIYMIVFGAVFLLSQLSVWYSACQLGCCLQAMEPVYSK